MMNNGQVILVIDQIRTDFAIMTEGQPTKRDIEEAVQRIRLQLDALQHMACRGW
jgi:hypothetical protein